jgi:hypothetical protein
MSWSTHRKNAKIAFHETVAISRNNAHLICCTNLSAADQETGVRLISRNSRKGTRQVDKFQK